jgi:hypothetical protein
MRTRKIMVIAMTASVLLSAHAWAGTKMNVEVVETSALITTGPAFFTTIFAKVILPDGSHASLICGDRQSDKNCAKIEPISPEKMPANSTTCDTQGRQMTCVTYNLGRYEAERKGNELTIRPPMAN